MWKDVCLLAASCVLFVNMGLSDALQEFFGFHSRILSCPKCLTFWTALAFLLVSRCRFVTAVGASFLLSYLALWADLGLSALNRIYNESYEQLSSPPARPGKARPPAGSPGVSPVRRQNKKKKWKHSMK